MSNAPPRVRSGPRRAGPFRTTVIAASLALLLLQIRELVSVSPVAELLLCLLVFLSRSIPVALSREKPITFTAAFVFSASLLLNGVAAGWIALLACVVHARISRRGDRDYALFLGAQYALSAMGAHVTFSTLAGHAQVSPKPDLAELGCVCASMAAFILTNATLVGLASHKRQARRDYAEAAFRLHALAYGASFPFAVLMVFAVGSLGLAVVPCLAAVVFICAHAVRMTVENRLLTRQLWAVEQIGGTCASGVRTEMPLSRFLDLARELVSFDQGVLWLVEEGSHDLRPRVVFPEGSQPPDLALAENDSLLSRASERSEPLIVADASRDPRNPTGTPSAAWLLYPIILHGRCVGVAQFARSASRPFERQEVERLAVLVPHTAVAFESVRVRHLMHRYADMATSDGLTGLLNHRRSQELLREELSRAQRYNRSLAVLMIDVDSFKQFNDTYGHPQGDVLLKSIARIVRGSVRNVDHVGRYGGEEFIVILPETGREEACALAERIRRMIEMESFPTGDGRHVHRTVSIGLAAFPGDGITAAELIQIADDALYRAKRSGRNRVLTA